MVTISRGMLFLLLRLLLGFFLFFADFIVADGIDGAERAQTTLPQSAFALELGLRLNGEAGPGNGFQPGLRNGFARQLANAIGILFNALEGLFDFIDGVLVRRQETQSKVAV